MEVFRRLGVADKLREAGLRQTIRTISSQPRACLG